MCVYWVISIPSSTKKELGIETTSRSEKENNLQYVNEKLKIDTLDSNIVQKMIAENL